MPADWARRVRWLDASGCIAVSVGIQELTEEVETVMSDKPVTQLKDEHSRTVVEGRRTDDGDLCTLVVVREVSGTWALYPHGDAKFGVRLAGAEALKVAQAILAGEQ